MSCDQWVFPLPRSALWYLHKHITSAVKVFCQLVTFLILRQDGLHLHHPGSDKHIIGLNIPEKMDNSDI